MKGCRCITYHLTVHTIIMHMSKKTSKEREGGGGGGVQSPSALCFLLLVNLTYFMTASSIHAAYPAL